MASRQNSDAIAAIRRRRSLSRLRNPAASDQEGLILEAEDRQGLLALVLAEIDDTLLERILHFSSENAAFDIRVGNRRMTRVMGGDRDLAAQANDTLATGLDPAAGGSTLAIRNWISDALGPATRLHVRPRRPDEPADGAVGMQAVVLAEDWGLSLDPDGHKLPEDPFTELTAQPEISGLRWSRSGPATVDSDAGAAALDEALARLVCPGGIDPARPELVILPTGEACAALAAFGSDRLAVEFAEQDMPGVLAAWHRVVSGI